MDSQLHIALFPYMAHGHMIPTMDMARIFASNGVKATIITTPSNVPFFSKAIERDRQLGFEIFIQLMNFPTAEVGLPEGCDNASSIIAPEMIPKFCKAVSLLQNPLENILKDCHPNCLVADMMFPWATDVASKFGIPRLVFHGVSTFALCVLDSLRRYETHKSLASDFDHFTVLGLPNQIKLTRLQLPNYIREKNEHTEAMDQIIQSEVKSYGVLINSFYELEPAYLDTTGRALEASGQNFIWVVKKEEKFLPEGFERRMEGKGLIIRGWAPQVLILDHEATGGFMTHCGWNSTLEAVASGVPMVTWPLYAEQFFNEKLVTEVLKVGISVGSQEWSRHEKKILVRMEDIEKAVNMVMVGEEGEVMKNRAKELEEMSRKAVENGGSSFSDLNALLEELKVINV
ncbi:hypothetical protein GH714_014581 [Hevea brasiliensis]|uniref:Glycosyltransferase n=1 Tax=Hevea brasiliensis TaxID=3981 RepID=A0A6A6L3F3_HEVBR|nr:hypothetical protein GH714_014581 [Hevea brasiliensis]